MRELIKKILKETSSKKLKSEFLNMGVEGAKRLGVSPTDYLNIVFDGDVVSYVSHFLNPLLHLNIYSSGKLYMHDGDGPFQGTVFEYDVRKPFNQNVRRVLLIPKKKYDYIMKFMNEETLTEFLNEYYELYFDKIVPQKEVNFG
jgi:hypothetical protein